MYIRFIVGSQGVKQITHVITKTGNHLFKLIATPFEWLSTRFIGKDFVNKQSRFRYFWDQTSKLLECIDVLISFHAYIARILMQLHSPRWSQINRIFLAYRTPVVVWANLVAVVHSLRSSHATLDHTAEKKHSWSFWNQPIDLVFEA